MPPGEPGGVSSVAGSCLAGTLDTDPPHWPEGGVAYFVEGVVEQGERRAEQGDQGTGDDRPQVLPGLQRLVVLGPVEHRAPAHRAPGPLPGSPACAATAPGPATAGRCRTTRSA